MRKLIVEQKLDQGPEPQRQGGQPGQRHPRQQAYVAFTPPGGHFLSGLVPQLLRELGPRGFLVLTWDEGSSDAGCCTDAHGGRIATIVAGPGARRGVRSVRPVDHYGVIHTVESALGLAPLGGAAQPRSGTLEALLAHAHARVAR